MRIVRPPREAFTVVAILFIVFYLVGGAGGVREVRSRIRSWLEPPTTEQVARATRADADTAVVAPRAARLTARKKVWLSDPPSRVVIVGALGGILVVTFGLMFLTARPD